MYQDVAPEKGKCGPVELFWGVDLEFQFMSYDPSLAAYGGGAVDGVTITNMDMLPSGRKDVNVVIFATSTSWGADRIIVPKSVTSLDSVKKLVCRGLDATVSHYGFEEPLRVLGLNPNNFQYKAMTPEAAAASMKARDPEIQCIAVWEPFALDVVRDRGDVHSIIDSKRIPAEILDLVVVGQSALDKPHGKSAALALIDAWYRVIARLEDPAESDTAHRRLGKKVSDLDADSMRDVRTRSLFYVRPQWVLDLFAGKNPYPFPDGTRGMPLTRTMPKVAKWMKDKKAIDEMPTVGYGTKAEVPDTKFRFDPSYVREYMSRSGASQ